MYNELLKQHEDILKKLTDKASKETDFGERGQFMNLQKMVTNETFTIKELKDLASKDESNKLCAYKLGVGKILIGQRGSGISSTLIDECLKYNRPLIVESNHRAEQLSKLYPNLTLAYFIKDFNKDCLALMNVNKEIVDFSDAQVNVELNTTNNINKDILEKVKLIKPMVGIIGTVGISRELEEQQPIWVPRNSEMPKIRKKVTKELASTMLSDYSNHLQGNGVFDSTRTLKEKYDFIIKLMSE